MTATHHAPHQHGHSTPGAMPEPHDPEHDIDAKSASIWVISSTIVLFVALYFLLPLFDLVLTTERDRKINNIPAAELDDLVAKEKDFLNGKTSRSKKSIEQVMTEMVKK